jgi:orotidine-5'-phosphate decarboxylase
MRAAREAVAGKKRSPALLGVTLLTSLDAQALESVGIAGPVEQRAVALARLAQEACLDGVVTSMHEAKAIRQACGPKFMIVVPGVRPSTAAAQDQSRVATPADAIRGGADYLVVGRPITEAKDPRSTARSIAAEIGAASAARR